MTSTRLALLSAALPLLAACATTAAVDPGEAEASAMLSRMLSGQSAIDGAELEAALEEAAQHPLGARENPVRAAGPSGQRAYLSRLRCADLKQPEFHRIGSMGVSPYGNIMDGYAVTCPGSEPAEQTIHMDMYHAGHVESRAVEGYGITGGRSE